MKKLLLIILAILGTFHANLLAQPVNRIDGLKSWHPLFEENVTAQVPTIKKAFESNNTTSRSIKLDSIIALKSQLQYFTYDSLGHWLTDIDYSGWDSVKNVYTAGYRHFNTYANGFLVTQILKNYDYINNGWYFSYKAEFTNNVQGHPTSYTFYGWNPTKSTWDAQSKYVYTYNTGGKLTQETDSVWNKTTLKFDNSYKYEFQYDANGNQILKTTYNWKIDSLKWSKYSRNENTYDANGNITLIKNYGYGGTGNSSLSNQYEYSYEGNNLISLTHYYSTFGSTTLTILDKLVYSYDTNGNRTQEIDSLWDDNKHVWLNSHKNAYTYDLSVNVANVVCPLPGDNWVKNKITSFQSILWMVKKAGTQPQWYAQPVRQYYYSDYGGIIPMAIEQKSTNNIHLYLYPNPFKLTTTINYKVTEPGLISLKIFDAMGTEVTSLVNEQTPAGEYSIGWNAAGKPSGIYYCRLQNGKNSEVKKMLLLK
jgi:hypothetical protein